MSIMKNIMKSSLLRSVPNGKLPSRVFFGGCLVVTGGNYNVLNAGGQMPHSGTSNSVRLRIMAFSVKHGKLVTTLIHNDTSRSKRSSTGITWQQYP